ncbi:hypothetical protein CEXT_808981 [Caerostris extrusa]|uniref:Uncharacterized protein n=1 Tax=Caerostris extrusa TaxID=172846 RepID=A0AAV4Y7X4_CAEEX|nr:hypothetical protein CEXT_808981 [Caerostris extrusa]
MEREADVADDRIGVVLEKERKNNFESGNEWRGGQSSGLSKRIEQRNPNQMHHLCSEEVSLLCYGQRDRGYSIKYGTTVFFVSSTFSMNIDEEIHAVIIVKSNNIVDIVKL